MRSPSGTRARSRCSRPAPAVLGIVFIAVAVTGLIATWRSSIGGRDGRALAHAVIGGVACLAAAGCFAVAIILGLVSGS